MKGVAMSADLVESGAISGKILKDLYDLCFERKQDFPDVYEKEKPQQITDTSSIEKIIDEVLAAFDGIRSSVPLFRGVPTWHDFHAAL